MVAVGWSLPPSAPQPKNPIALQSPLQSRRHLPRPSTPSAVCATAVGTPRLPPGPHDPGLDSASAEHGARQSSREEFGEIPPTNNDTQRTPLGEHVQTQEEH